VKGEKKALDFIRNPSDFNWPWVSFVIISKQNAQQIYTQARQFKDLAQY